VKHFQGKTPFGETIVSLRVNEFLAPYKTWNFIGVFISVPTAPEKSSLLCHFYLLWNTGLQNNDTRWPAVEIILAYFKILLRRVGENRKLILFLYLRI
jgi:hypothetical protein